MGVSVNRRLTGAGWWTLFLICVLFSGFALFMAGTEIASWFVPEVESKLRALPRLFAIHAISGAVVLLVGPLQFRPIVRRRWPAAHRIAGRTYVIGIWISSMTAAILIPAFDVSMTAKLVFGLLSVLWFFTTTIGLRRAVSGNLSSHRRWMMRSFALSLFFVTGSIWMEISRSLPWPPRMTYPIAIFLGWAINLAVVELWIQRR